MSSAASLSRQEIRRRYLAVDTAAIADLLDQLGLPDQGLAPDFAALPTDNSRLAGWACTIRAQAMPFTMEEDAWTAGTCQGLSPGDVVVWSGSFSERIALGMKERGAVGSLVDGGVRDMRWFAQHGFPVFARYRAPVQSIGRWKVSAWQVPVLIQGATSKFVRVDPGDFILADADGAIAIPADVVAAVLCEAEKLTDTETRIREELARLTFEGGREDLRKCLTSSSRLSMARRLQPDLRVRPSRSRTRSKN